MGVMKKAVTKFFELHSLKCYLECKYKQGSNKYFLQDLAEIYTNGLCDEKCLPSSAYQCCVVMLHLQSISAKSDSFLDSTSTIILSVKNPVEKHSQFSRIFLNEIVL